MTEFASFEELVAVQERSQYGTALLVMSVLALSGCAQGASGTTGSGLTPGSHETSAIDSGVVTTPAQVDTCASDGPTYETLDEAIAASVVVVHGTVDLAESQSTPTGAPPGAAGWLVTVKETWGTGVGDVVEVVAAEQVEGMEPCGARLTPGSEAFLFLSNEASSDTDVFYPVVVLTKDASSGEYIDSSGRIPNHGGAGHRGRTDGQHGVIGT